MPMNTGVQQPLSNWRQAWTRYWQGRYQHWIRRRIPPARHITLNQGNIFIIPNKQGLGFLAILGLMFIGAINYEISLAFALVFWLLGVLILTIFYLPEFVRFACLCCPGWGGVCRRKGQYHRDS
jgi:hypothetical protein